MAFKLCCRRRDAQPPQSQWLRISSLCSGSVVRLAEPRDVFPHRDKDSHDKSRAGWEGFCACCKRPLSFELVDAPESSESVSSERAAKRRRLESGGAETSWLPKERYAYVCSLWGGKSDAGYLLGALVLGWSLRKTGTPHDLVILVTQVEPAAQQLLQQAGWIVREVDHVQATENLSAWYCLEMHFAQVFTKIHVLGLVEYTKVVMLDVDILVSQNIDELFSMPAPAALTRGPRVGYSHGERIDCRYFFGGSCNGPTNWGQANGINAGVMLLEPNYTAFSTAMAEIGNDRHPEHIRGKGPEQDYLSRFYAGPHEKIPGLGWHHMDSAYNFQLHQMYFTLNPKYSQSGDRIKFFHDPSLVKVYHYSCGLKPWDRFLDDNYANHTDEQWTECILETFKGYWYWIKRDPETVQQNQGFEGVALGPDGRFHFIDWHKYWAQQKAKQWNWKSWNAFSDNSSTEDNSDNNVQESSDYKQQSNAIEYPLGEVVEVPEYVCTGAQKITHMSLQTWSNAFRDLEADLGLASLAASAKAAVCKVVDKPSPSDPAEPSPVAPDAV